MSKHDTGPLSRRRLLRAAGATGAAGAIGLAGNTIAAETASVDPYGDPEYPSDEWFAREQSNWEKTREEPVRQANDPGFQKRWEEQSTTNYVGYRQQNLEETEWDRSGLCRRWTNQCTGDPYRYPAEDPVWSGDPFYEETGTVERVVFYDRADDAARLNGRVWAPRDLEPGDERPGVVVMCGGAATETMYWWFAQSLVENGYVALTFDPNGQGRSEESDLTHTDHHVDALDFFTSTPDDPYPHNEGNERVDHDTVPVAEVNPFHDRLDLDRVATAGHSRGASSTSVVQGLDPWPGVGDNPVTVGVAWDNPNPAGSEYDGYRVSPRVPLMGQSADYKGEGAVDDAPILPSSWTPQPKHQPPDPEARNAAYHSWRDAGLPAMQVNLRGTTHFEWSQVPTFPATRWESWGNEAAEHYSIAWFDYWLKDRGEPGHDDALDRLLAEEPWHDRLSFYYTSKYAVPANTNGEQGRGGQGNDWYVCGDMLATDC